MVTLRPPLPPPLSHTGIHFELGSLPENTRLPGEVIAAIAVALCEQLPETPQSASRSEFTSLWRDAGRSEGTNRWPL
jgi:hypothetical protein